MKTDYIVIKEPSLQAAEIERAAGYLKKGEIAAIPTETVYGLAANAFDENAVKKIFAAKGRPQDNPLIVHIAEKEELYSLARVVPPKALELADRYWPGPLTMILPKKDCVPDVVSAGLDTVAIRMPSHPTARAVIKAAGFPLAAPSANISGFPSPSCAEYVKDDMDGRIACIVDSGDCEYGIESTVVTLATNPPRLLRPGGITHAQLEAVLGKTDIDDAVLNPLKAGKTAASPGMKYKHYAPKARLSIVTGDFESFSEFVKKHKNEADFALVFEGEQDRLPLPCVCFGKEDDSLSQAHALFDALRELDALGAQKVFVRSPSREGVGLGVCNRLYRAAGFTFLSDRKGEITGITGPSGSGKSTVCDILRKKGAVIIDADKKARDICEKGSPVLEKLALAFGGDIILPNGTLDRRELASRAFENEKNTRLLTDITHPEIVSACLSDAEKFTDEGFDVIIDAPLLFSSGLDKICTRTVKVTAPEEIRLERVMKRDGISRNEALKRFAAQRQEDILSEKADIIISNCPPYDIKEEAERRIPVKSAFD